MLELKQIEQLIEKGPSFINFECDENKKTYKDVLIYRRDYKLTNLDNDFITAVCDAKRKYVSEPF